MTNSQSKNRLNRYFQSPLSEVDALVNHFFGPGPKSVQRVYFAPTSVWEEDDAYHIELDIPGVAKEDVELTFDQGKLSISVERKAPEEKQGRWHEERTYGKAVREVGLSAHVDPESITAEVANGVLHVRVGKTPEAQPKRIELN